MPTFFIVSIQLVIVSFSGQTGADLIVYKYYLMPVLNLTHCALKRHLWVGDRYANLQMLTSLASLQLAGGVQLCDHSQQVRLKLHIQKIPAVPLRLQCIVG